MKEMPHATEKPFFSEAIKILLYVQSIDTFPDPLINVFFFFYIFRCNIISENKYQNDGCLICCAQTNYIYRIIKINDGYK